MAIKTFIISGFLGCGKTELVRNIISKNPEKKIVVIENEVAEFGIDGKVSSSNNVKVIEINDGSISSVNLKNLNKVVKKCLKKFKPDIFIIEASGAANLDPVLSMLRKFRVLELYGITVIDAERFSKAKKLSSHTLEHVAQASVVILNKCDIVDKKTKNIQLRNLKLLNSNIIETSHSKADIKGIKPLKIKKTKKGKSQSYLFWKIKNNLGMSISKEEKHSNINAYVYEVYGTIDSNMLKNFFQKNNFPRAKGFIYLEDRKLHYFNVINNHFYLQEAPEQHIPHPGLNRIVLIGEKVFSRRRRFKRLISNCIYKGFVNHLQNIFWALKNQQRLPERVVYL